MSESLLLVEREDQIAILTLNRPQVMNSFNFDMLRALRDQVETLRFDPDVRVVIITGAGDRAFCAGADLKERATLSPVQVKEYIFTIRNLFTTIEQLPKPVIAAVNGYALGGGLELALACDFIYASEKARLGFPEVTLGIIPGFGGTQNLSRRIGVARANELIFTGKMVDAAKAAEWGIVNEVFAPEELLPKALETARSIAKLGTLAIASAKNAIANGLNMGKEDGFRYEASLFGVLFATEDQKEGMGAFVEKRKAEFKGK